MQHPHVSPSSVSWHCVLAENPHLPKTLLSPQQKQTLSVHELELLQAIPSEIWDVVNPPHCLYLQGTRQAFSYLSKLPESALAIVGTRHPQSRSAQYLRQIVEELEGSALMIISGLAKGVDTIAHTAALAAHLPTLAVLGTGIDLCYPAENRSLVEKILEADGLIASEFAPGTPPRGFHFLRRNRLIAGWSKATWVVEAGLRSGALNTARWAREQNKTCFTVPCYPNDFALAGNQILLDRDHAVAVWGSHSFGAAWLELAARPHSPHFKTKTCPVTASPATNGVKTSVKLHRLLSEVHRCSIQEGGIHSQTLFDWAIQDGWDPSEFFLTLELALQTRAIYEHSGLLVARLSFRSMPDSPPTPSEVPRNDQK
jgi:DNA protecting protein DprA